MYMVPILSKHANVILGFVQTKTQAGHGAHHDMRSAEAAPGFQLRDPLFSTGMYNHGALKPELGGVAAVFAQISADLRHQFRRLLHIDAGKYKSVAESGSAPVHNIVVPSQPDGNGAGGPGKYACAVHTMPVAAEIDHVLGP